MRKVRESGQERLLGFLFILQGVFLKRGRLFKKDGHVFKKDGHLFPAPKIHTDLHSYLLEIKQNAANEEVEVQNDKNAHSIG